MRSFLCTLLIVIVAGCSAQPPDDGWRIALEDPDAGRIAVCNPGNGSFTYVTPDSLYAEGPVTDSSWSVIYFLGYPRTREGTVNAVYAVGVDGSDLRKISDLPLRALDLQVSPNGRTIVFTGRYPDQEFIRGYQMTVGESGFRATTPGDRNAYDPAMAPGGLNYVFHDSTMADTLWVSSLQETLNLPIYRDFVYTQVSISPDALNFAAVCGEQRRGLCYMHLPERAGRVLIPEQDGVSITHPVCHPDSVTVGYVHHEGGRTQLRTIDVNSLEIKEIPLDLPHPTRPAWVRSADAQIR
jgi:hypothetical protein